MTCTGAMVLPQNAMIMKEEERRYVGGGATSTWTSTAKNVRRRLNSFVFCAGNGSALASNLWGNRKVIVTT